MPLRGKGAADLPATVRVVAESSCSGADIIGFWAALGFQRRYSMVKEGFCVSCYLDDHFVHVAGAFNTLPVACTLVSFSVQDLYKVNSSRWHKHTSTLILNFHLLYLHLG